MLGKKNVSIVLVCIKIFLTAFEPCHRFYNLSDIRYLVLVRTSWLWVKRVYRPIMSDLTPVWLTFIPRALAPFAARRQKNLERALKERIWSPRLRPPSLYSPSASPSIIRRGLPIMKPKLSATYGSSRRFSLRPPLLIVPETTDGNCERKHVNTAEVTAEEQRSPPAPYLPVHYDVKLSKALGKQALCVRSDSCQDPAHRSINPHENERVQAG